MPRKTLIGHAAFYPCEVESTPRKHVLKLNPLIGKSREQRIAELAAEIDALVRSYTGHTGALPDFICTIKKYNLHR